MSNYSKAKLETVANSSSKQKECGNSLPLLRVSTSKNPKKIEDSVQKPWMFYKELMNAFRAAAKCSELPLPVSRTKQSASKEQSSLPTTGTNLIRAATVPVAKAGVGKGASKVASQQTSSLRRHKSGSSSTIRRNNAKEVQSCKALPSEKADVFVVYVLCSNGGERRFHSMFGGNGTQDGESGDSKIGSELCKLYHVDRIVWHYIDTEQLFWCHKDKSLISYTALCSPHVLRELAMVFLFL